MTANAKVPSAFVNKDSVLILVDAVNPSAGRTYHPVNGLLAKAQVAKGLTIILCPFSATIPGPNHVSIVIRHPTDLTMNPPQSLCARHVARSDVMKCGSHDMNGG